MHLTSISVPPTKWTINFDFNVESIFLTFFLILPGKPIKFYVSGQSKMNVFFLQFDQWTEKTIIHTTPL